MKPVNSLEKKTLQTIMVVCQCTSPTYFFCVRCLQKKYQVRFNKKVMFVWFMFNGNIVCSVWVWWRYAVDLIRTGFELLLSTCKSNEILLLWCGSDENMLVLMQFSFCRYQLQDKLYYSTRLILRSANITRILLWQIE